jgi:hypothetical protein
MHGWNSDDDPVTGPPRGSSIAGLAIDRTFPVGADATAHAGSGHVFGIFETNGWHSSAGLLIGVISLYFALRPEHARGAALNLGISQLIVVVSFALLPPSTFWFASNGADQVIHTLTAVWGIGAALATRPVRSRA